MVLEEGYTHKSIEQNKESDNFPHGPMVKGCLPMQGN